MSWAERWDGFDKGLIFCWEKGRQLREQNPNLADRAEAGELVMLNWKGGVDQKLKSNTVKKGTYFYLATWQGLRGVDLNIPLGDKVLLECSKYGQFVEYSGVIVN